MDEKAFGWFWLYKFLAVIGALAEKASTMLELLRLGTERFEFSVWCNDITKRQQVYQTMLANRRKAAHSIQTLTGQSSFNFTEVTTTESGLERKSIIRFDPVLMLKEPVLIKGKEFSYVGSQLAELLLDEPLFFENIQYQFEWIFFDAVEDAYLTHRSALLNDGFRFAKEKKGLIPARLTGTINTGNDVGWMKLPLEYIVDGKVVKSSIAFEVLPTKMDLHHDLPAMYRVIDKNFPLWRFGLAGKTGQDASKGKHRGNFPLMWLANFSQMRVRFEKGLKVIAQAPHSRLQTHEMYTRADRLKGRISHKLGVKVLEDIANGRYDRRYKVSKKRLDVNTPENRFIKNAIQECKKKLGKFEKNIRNHNQKTENRQRVSEAFISELGQWQQPLQKMLEQSFLSDVGSFSGLNGESLVLQQKTGYSEVYKVWNELRFYLDAFANQTEISMKSVAEIYEIWCFLTLKQILEEQLGFKISCSKKQVLKLNNFFEYQFKDGLAGAFEFERGDGLRARLAHEPKFTKNSGDIRTFVVNQEPDIVLEVTFPWPSKKSFVWLFDAKYRIKSDQSETEDVEKTDFVPDDAINQMHRYRDALIRISKSYKSRPVFGAFALYPGYFDQESTQNPYHEAITEIGIGAFALLPNMAGGSDGNIWLLEFLKEQIGGNPAKVVNNLEALSDQLYMQEAARIPYSGMQQSLYQDLVMTAALGGEEGREIEYFEAFENGTAKWFHLPEKTFLSEYKQHIINEILYLALADTPEENPGFKKINKLWPVKKVSLVARSDINVEQAGKQASNNELYYLFKLGKPLYLNSFVSGIKNSPYRATMKLTTLGRLEKARVFSELEVVYPEAVVG